MNALAPGVRYVQPVNARLRTIRPTCEQSGLQLADAPTPSSCAGFDPRVCNLRVLVPPLLWFLLIDAEG